LSCGQHDWPLSNSLTVNYDSALGERSNGH
jgi:hypothetical protein